MTVEHIQETTQILGIQIERRRCFQELGQPLFDQQAPPLRGA